MGSHINSLRALRSIPGNDCFVKNVKPQLGNVPSHHLYFFAQTAVFFLQNMLTDLSSQFYICCSSIGSSKGGKDLELVQNEFQKLRVVYHPL